MRGQLIGEYIQYLLYFPVSLPNRLQTNSYSYSVHQAPGLLFLTKIIDYHAKSFCCNLNSLCDLGMYSCDYNSYLHLTVVHFPHHLASAISCLNCAKNSFK